MEAVTEETLVCGECFGTGVSMGANGCRQERCRCQVLGDNMVELKAIMLDSTNRHNFPPPPQEDDNWYDPATGKSYKYQAGRWVPNRPLSDVNFKWKREDFGGE